MSDLSWALVQEPRQVVCAWGLVVVVAADGGVTCLREKPLPAKLELLHAKSLYLVALNLAQSEQVALMLTLTCLCPVYLTPMNLDGHA